MPARPHAPLTAVTLSMHRGSPQSSALKAWLHTIQVTRLHYQRWPHVSMHHCSLELQDAAAVDLACLVRWRGCITHAAWAACCMATPSIATPCVLMRQFCWMHAPRCSALQVHSFGEGSFGALGEDFRGSSGGSSMGFLPSNAESDTRHKTDPVPKMLSGP